jgi:hypothetical protein
VASHHLPKQQRAWIYRLGCSGAKKVQNRLRTQKKQGQDDRSVRDSPTSNQYSVGVAFAHHITRVAPVDRISSRGAPRDYPGAGDTVAQTSGGHGVAQDVGSPGKGLSLVFQDQVDDGKCTAMIIPLGSAYLPKSHAPVKGPRTLILLVDVNGQFRRHPARIRDESTPHSFAMLLRRNEQHIDLLLCHAHKAERLVCLIDGDPKDCLGQVLGAHKPGIELDVSLAQEEVRRPDRPKPYFEQGIFVAEACWSNRDHLTFPAMHSKVQILR